MKKVAFFVMVLVVGLVIGIGSAQVGAPPPPDKVPPLPERPGAGVPKVEQCIQIALDLHQTRENIMTTIRILNAISESKNVRDWQDYDDVFYGLMQFKVREAKLVRALEKC